MALVWIHPRTMEGWARGCCVHVFQVPEIVTNTITKTNKLLRASSVLAAESLGIKARKKNNKKVELWWKRRINRDIERLRKEINVLERKKRGDLRKKVQKTRGKVQDQSERINSCNRRIKAMDAGKDSEGKKIR